METFQLWADSRTQVQGPGAEAPNHTWKKFKIFKNPLEIMKINVFFTFAPSPNISFTSPSWIS